MFALDSQDEEISIVDEIPRRQNDKRSDKPSTSDGEPPSKWSRKNEPEVRLSTLFQSNVICF